MNRSGARYFFPEMAQLRSENKARRISATAGLDLSVVYLSVANAAEKAGVSQPVIRRAINEENLAVASRHQPGISKLLIHPDELARWMKDDLPKLRKRKPYERKKTNAA